MVAVAVAQYAPGVDKEANLRTAAEMAEAAHARGARILVLPEYAMFTAARTDHRFVESAEPLDGKFAAGLRDLAGRLDMFVVAGVNEAIGDPGYFSNSLLAVAPDGELAAVYRKLHLYDAFGMRESDVVRAGAITPPETFTADGLVFGLQTCYDLRFPEVTRRIVDAGADVLLLAAEWVPGPLKEEHWRTLLRARAIENTMYIAAAGQNAPTGSGNSMILDPMGTAVAALGEETGIAVAQVEGKRIAEVRTRNPALALRRFTVISRE